jgi:hypothetical protein
MPVPAICFSRGSHRNMCCTSICDSDQSEIKGSSTLISNDQRIKMAFRPKIRSKLEIIYLACLVYTYAPPSYSVSNFQLYFVLYKMLVSFPDLTLLEGGVWELDYRHVRLNSGCGYRHTGHTGLVCHCLAN